MRHTARVLLVLLAVAYCPAAMAAEQSGLRLWPFRGDRTDNSELTGNSLAPKAPATATAGPSATMPSQPPTTRYTDELPEQHWMLNSPLARVSWPRIHMPEVSLPKPKIPRPQIWPRKSQVDDARNAWVQKSPDPARPTPLQAMKQGAQRVGQSTRTAWRKTVDVLTPGDAPSASDPRVAARDQNPTLWQRMRGTQPEQKQGSQTVSEFIAQERLNP
ncbi:MAG TPA: hypothetical protein VHK01_22830 [Lacipirellulaceae bacterium]|jgi:hypothetical protein|nr:hypothetical protein [Lacipirellulaceae bacterium]